MKNVPMEHFTHEKEQIWAAITELRNNFSENGDKIKSIAEKSKELYTEIETSHEQIKNYGQYVKYFQENKSVIDGIKTNYENTLKKIENAISSCDTLMNNISENNDNSESFLDQIESDASSAKSNLEEITSISQKISTSESEAKSTKDKIEGYYKNIIGVNNEINDAYNEIFGYETDQTDADGDVIRQKGLIDTLNGSFDNLSKAISITKQDNEKSKSELKNWILEKSEEIELKKKEIEDLLPDAMAAGLSSAFYKKKEDEILSYKSASKIFNLAIFGMCIASLLVIAVSAYLMKDGKTLIETIGMLPRIAIGIAPLYLPLLWLAFSASKRRNLSKRLIEEYTHKEVLAKTFVGLSKHIGDSDDEDKNELRDALLNNIITASAGNPGELITGFNDAEHPVLDMIKSIFNLRSQDKKT